MTDTPVADALTAFRASGSPWLSLPFFAGGEADAVAARVDARIAAGARVLPAPDRIFRALTETPPQDVRAVILGQDPYPTPGDANGLAFSFVGSGRLPASLKVILAEAGSDRAAGGDLRTLSHHQHLRAAQFRGQAGPHPLLVADQGAGGPVHFLELLRRGQPVGGAHVDILQLLPLQPRHAHGEELVQIGAGNRQETQPLQQGMRPVHRLFQHALVERQPGQFPVEIAVAGQGQAGGGVGFGHISLIVRNRRISPGL